MARMNADWGFPDPYYPAAPVGMFSYSSDLATQYVTGFPPYMYMPTFWGSLRVLTIADPRFGIPNIPYATSSEIVHNSALAFTDAFIRDTVVLGAALATIGGALYLERHVRTFLYEGLHNVPIAGRVTGALHKTLGWNFLFGPVTKFFHEGLSGFPVVGSVIKHIESGIDELVGETGLLTRGLRVASHVPVVGSLAGRVASWLSGMTGASVTRFLFGSLPGFLIAEWLASKAIGNLFVDPIATTIGDTKRIRASLGRLMMGSEEWNPATGTIRSSTAHEIFKEINRIWANEITVQYEDVMAILTAGSQLGLFDPIGPNKDRIIQAIKTIASHLRVISEIARDPSMVDTLKNLSALAQMGVPVEMTPLVYKQMAITSTAYGRPLSQMFPILQQEYGQFFMQLGLSPYTGIVVGNEALLYSTVMNEVLRERGMHLFASSLGGAEGIARMNAMLFGQLLKSDPLTQYMIISSGFGPLGKLDFGKSIDARTFFMYQLFDEEIAKKITEEYGGAQWFNLHRGLLLNQFLEKTVRDPFTRAYVLRQLGAPPELARAVATGDFSFYVDTVEKMAIRRRQAELSNALNEMELRTYGILGPVSLFFRRLKTWPREFWSDFIGDIKEDVENFRLEVRLGMVKNPILRKLGEWIWGAPQAGRGSLIGLQSKYFGTNVTLDEETILETFDLLGKVNILSDDEKDILNILVNSVRKKDDAYQYAIMTTLFEAHTEDIRRRIPLVTQMENEGFREKIIEAGSPMEVIRLTNKEYSSELGRLDKEERRDIFSYWLSVWKKERGITDSELQRIIQSDVEKYIEYLELPEIDIQNLITSEAERDVIESFVTGEYKKIKLLNAPIDEIRNRISLVAKMEEEGFRQQVRKFDSPLEAVRFVQTHYGDDFRKYDKVTQSDIIAYSLTVWREEKGLTDKEVDKYVQEDLSKLTIDDLIFKRAGIERYLVKKIEVDLEDTSSVGSWGEFAFLGDYVGYNVGDITPEAVKVFKVIKSDTSKVLESGQFEGTTYTKEEYKYISAYLKEKASNKELSSEAVRGYELLREKVGLERHLTPEEAAILYGYTDQGKLFEQLSSYDKVKEKEEILRRLPGAIPFSFGLQDLHKKSQEYFVDQFMKSDAREVYFDLMRVYYEATEDKKITPEERIELNERVTRLKSFIREVAQNAPEDLRRRLLELANIQDPVEFSKQLYQGFMIGIKGDIGIQEKVGLVNTLRSLADVSGTLEKNFKLLNDALGGLLRKLGYSPYGTNVAGG
ncbi:MAG: hypothetical protein DSY42_02190 [Aquifex sp.]|nr:MAG: hypothetical protein DSY42_02190 [Aquifex sp.]